MTGARIIVKGIIAGHWMIKKLTDRPKLVSQEQPAGLLMRFKTVLEVLSEFAGKIPRCFPLNRGQGIRNHCG